MQLSDQPSLYIPLIIPANQAGWILVRQFAVCCFIFMFFQNNNIKSASATDKAYAADYECEYPGQVYAKWIEDGELRTDVYNEEYGISLANIRSVTLSDDYSATAASETQCLASNMSKILLAESEEEFEQVKADIIQECKDLGADELEAEVNRQLEEMDWGEYSRK